LEDEKACKGLVSEKINNEIKLIKDEVKQMDDFQHQKLDEQISLFTNEIADLDQKQHKAIDDEITLFADECTKMEDKLHAMLEDQKAKYQENAHTLQQELTKTIKDNIQNVKDAIADFTLNFMNSIDEGNEMAETNESKLTEIFENSLKFIEQKHTSTWHTLGSEALIGSINDAIWRTKSTVIVVTPIVIPKVLEVLSQCAYKKKNSRFFYTSNFDLATYQPILDKMKQLGNIQFRNLKGGNEFYACARDAEEVILAPNAKDQRDMIGIVSVQDGYCQLYSSFIGPIFQANSRPI